MALNSLKESSLAARVAEELRASIQAGELRPGERLVERKLAESLGVSHIPVREALARLAEEGIVVREPRRGARVAELDSQDLEEISSLRIILEQFMCLRVRERWNSDIAVELSRILDSMEAAVEAEDANAMGRLDAEFHEALARLADHHLLSDILSQLRSRITGFVRAANASLARDDRREHVESHRRIFDAIAEGDEIKINQVISDHVTAAVKRISDFRASSAQPGMLVNQ